MNKLSRVGVDLAKNIFQLHGVDRHGEIAWRRRLKRNNWLKVLLDRVEPGCTIGMEACTGAHHWARELQAKGFTVKLIAPQFVKPYVKSNKNDANDAEAVCEAMSRPTMRFVAVKTVEQRFSQLSTQKEPNPLFSLTSACQGLHYNPPVMPSGLCATESWVAAVAAVPA